VKAGREPTEYCIIGEKMLIFECNLKKYGETPAFETSWEIFLRSSENLEDIRFV